MGVDELVTGGDVTDPVVDSLQTDDSDITRLDATYGNEQYKLLEQKHRRIYPVLPWDTWSTNGFDYSEGVVLSPSSSGWDSNEAGWPSIVINGDTGEWIMLYTGNDGGGGDAERIGLATSTDGVSWSKSDNNPIIGTGGSGDWDELLAGESSIVRRGNQHWIYYAGENANNVRQLGLARTGVSGDPDDFTTIDKAGLNPLITNGASGAFDENKLFGPHAFRWEGKWHIHYVGQDSNGVRKIGGAWSLNGLDWTKYSSNPVLTPSGTSGDWRGSNVSQPCPLPHLSNGSDLPVYVSGDDGGKKRGGLAVVEDYPSGSVRWHPENPLLINSGTNFHDRHNRASGVLRNPGTDEWYIYLTAQSSNVDQHVGLAKMPLNQWGAI